MLSVGVGDGRKGIGLGFGAGEEMEETELEEGEACYYQDDDDESIDPDVALSYIDEKLQNVLGHFQKDFEGGVSAENLGAKFGGYGSFLPTYQRSPSIWSHPRTPQNVNLDTPTSPNILPLEGIGQNTMVPSCAPLSVRSGPASSSSAALPIARVPTGNYSVKQDVCMFSAQGSAELTTKHEDVNKLNKLANQNSLKVRIKVGNGNLSSRKNAEIYSGLGLDISPSSSLDDSPIESGGIYLESKEVPDESPTSILQTMTSFAVPGGLMLSPLPDSLLILTEKEILARDCIAMQESSSILLVDEPASLCWDGIVFDDKEIKAVEKSGRLVGLKSGNDKDAWNGISAHLKKELDTEIPVGDELSKAFKLTRHLECTDDDTIKGTAKLEALESISSQEVGRFGKLNAKTTSTEKVLEYKVVSSHNDISVDPRKNGKWKGGKSNGVSESKERKDRNGGPADPPKQVGQKATSYEQDEMKMPNGKEQPFLGGKKRSKGIQSNGISAVELPKQSSTAGSSAAPKDKKEIHDNDRPSKSKKDDSELHKEFRKASESNGDLFGDVKLEQSECRTELLPAPSKNTLKGSKFEDVEKETFAIADKSKDRSSGKRFDNIITSDSCPKAAPSVAPPSIGNEPVSDAVPATVAPVVIEESWVACDRCGKWRLLPFGSNPDDLPKNWLCSMLHWLPGKNRCNVLEEETTKALYALYQIPYPDGQNNLQSHPHGSASGGTLTGVRHLDQNHQDPSFHAVPSGGKKKHGPKEISNGTSHNGPMHFLNPTKKSQVASSKSRSLNDVNQSPSESSPLNKSYIQHLSKSSDLTGEKNRHKQEEKHALLEHYSDGGDAKYSKTKNKREADRDGSRASKKLRTEGVRCNNEDWNSDHAGAIGRVSPCSNGGLPAKATGNQKYNDYSSKVLKCDPKESLLVSVKKPKDRIQVSSAGGSQDTGNCNKRDISAKKRKVKEWQDNQIYPETLPGTECHLQHNMAFQEETSESMRRKEKKARVSKSEGKESSTSRGSGRTNKKGRGTQILMSCGSYHPVDGMEGGSMRKDQQQGENRGNTPAQGIMEGIDSLKRDLGYGQPSVAATSSSSKVSGSRKTKTNFQELKGSPVESVSSSPLRVCNPNKLTSTRRNVLGKDDGRNADFSVVGSPRRCSDGEGDGGGNRYGARKGIASFVAHRESLESSLFDYKHASCGEAGAQTEPSSFEFGNTCLANGDSDILEQHNPNPNELATKDNCRVLERVNYNRYHSNGSPPWKPGKCSSSWSKNKHKSSSSDVDRGKFKDSDSLSEQEELHPTNRLRHEVEFESHDCKPYEEEMRYGKHICQDESRFKPEKDDKNYAGKKDSAGKLSSESIKRENQSKFLGNEILDVKSGTICSKDGKSNTQQRDHEDERSSCRFLSDRTHRTERKEIVSGRGKLQLLPFAGGDKQETLSRFPRPVPMSRKGGGSDVLPVDASYGDALKASKQHRKPDSQNGVQHINLRNHFTPNGHGLRDVEALNTVRKDSSSQAAANAFLKEAADLKHSADRLKNSGSDLDSTGLYFEAALKFLHGASILESCNIESAKHGELTQSMSVYSSTAKLCEFCAREYEKGQDMAAAALAYKCMEVAYMRVTYSKHFIASRDTNELQRTLQMVPPGESPSSSASDVDNLNNQATLDKAALTKGHNSPQVTGNHVIVARNRPNFVRLLNFAQDVGFAMEASEKSQNAFAAANLRLEEAQSGDGISSVKRVLDFNFQDVEGLLRRVRQAMEAIGR